MMQTCHSTTLLDRDPVNGEDIGGRCGHKGMDKASKNIQVGSGFKPFSANRGLK